jgi:hypothetical protein
LTSGKKIASLQPVAWLGGILMSKVIVPMSAGEGIGKGIATVAIWGGLVGASYAFHSFGILTGVGAGLMFFASFLLTIGLWSR